MDPNGGGDEEEYGDMCLGGYALVRRDGKLVEYSSSEDPNWPPTKAQIISFKFNNQTEITNH